MRITRNIKTRTMTMFLQVFLQRPHGEQIVGGRVLGRIDARRCQSMRGTIGVSETEISPAENGAAAIGMARRDGRVVIVCR